MVPTEKSEFSLADLSLEPLQGEEPAQRFEIGNKSKFQIDRRSGKERRLSSDRREVLRFESDRRSGKDRRPIKGWEPGKNL